MSIAGAAAPGSQDPQKPVFRSGVNLVRVDVVALDAMNRPIADLADDEFEIFEDGTRHEIVSVERVELPTLPPRPPAMADVATNSGAGEGRMIFLVLDDPNSLAARTDAIKRAARRFVERLSPQDQVALLWVSLRRQGAREFTTNHAAILAAIDAFESEQSRIGRRFGLQPGAELPLDPESGMSFDSQLLAGLNLKALFDANRPFLVVQDVSRYLATVEGRRKAIVYIGQGATRQDSPGVASAEGSPSARESLGQLPVDGAIAAGIGGNVTFYSIDPSGPPTLDPAQDWANAPQAVGDFARLARETGGFAAFRSDIDEAVDRAVNATSVYYLLGYYAEPATPRERERERKIDVRTSRPNVRLLSRSSYKPEVTPVRTRARREAEAAVRDLVPRVDLGLKAFAAPFRNATRKEQAIEIAVEVSAAEFAPDTASAGFQDEVELVVTAIEPGAKVRATREVTAHVALDKTRAAALGAGRYLLCTRVDVAPGQYQLRIGVHSARAARSGSVYYDLTVPDFRARPVSLSGVVLGWATRRDPMPVARTDRAASLVPFLPVLTREFRPGDDAWAYARVYRAGAAVDRRPVVLTATVARVETGEVVWTAAEERSAAAFTTARESEYRVTLPLTELAPGAYRLRIEASGPDRQMTATRELDFSVLDPATSAAVLPDTPAPEFSPPAAAERRPQPLDLQAVLERAGEYLKAYLDGFSAVVAEEVYEQRVVDISASGNRRRPTTSRQLRSDLLLVRLPGESGWTPFRDVFEVNGRAVRDRDDRLRKLFIEMPRDAMTTARRILDESARYNIGSVYRNINQPLLALMLLLPENLPHLRFAERGEEDVEGVLARRVDYQEFGHPTLVRQAGSDRDMPSSGTLWIDPRTGRIVKMALATSDRSFRMETSVTYRPSETLGLWAPAEMSETYFASTERIHGKATYQNFRRFQVKTEMTVKPPKGRVR